jgi:hypothetical protein
MQQQQLASAQLLASEKPEKADTIGFIIVSIEGMP